jgi:hypothetical protein
MCFNGFQTHQQTATRCFDAHHTKLFRLQYRRHVGSINGGRYLSAPHRVQHRVEHDRLEELLWQGFVATVSWQLPLRRCALIQGKNSKVGGSGGADR